MGHLHDTPGALKALQQDIYRDKILRARQLTTEQRLADVFEQSNFQIGMMYCGALHRVGGTDREAGWRELARWFKRLDQVREHQLYVTELPADR